MKERKKERLPLCFVLSFYDKGGGGGGGGGERERCVCD